MAAMRSVFYYESADSVAELRAIVAGWQRLGYSASVSALVRAAVTLALPSMRAELQSAEAAARD